MSNQELIEQFQRCQVWQDPEQWEMLAILYCMHGYWLNAWRCFQLADTARAPVPCQCRTVSAETVEVSG